MKNITKDFLHGANLDQLEEVKWLIENPEWKQKPVDIKTFVNSPDYLNLKFTVNGNRGHGCRPRILERLIEIFDGNFQEFVLVCGIGWGKDFLCSIVLCYGLHILGCLKDPANYYGLSKGSNIHLMLMSINEKHAKDVLFGEIRARLDNSPWFKENYRYDPKIQTEFRFSGGVSLIPGNSRDTTFVGYNIFMGIIDEGDDYQVTEERNDALEGYYSIKDRITSRFRDQGMLGMIGSPKTVNGFMMTMYENEAGVKRRYTTHVPTWDSLLDTPILSGKTFEYKKMVIPIEYENSFRSDPERALRDLGARPMLSKQPYITLVDRIDDMFVVDQEMLFITNDDKEFSYKTLAPGIKGDPNEIYYGHLDLAINRTRGDRLGFAIGHSSDFIEIDGQELPEITIDIAMAVKAPPGGEIIFKDIKDIIAYLQSKGFSFAMISADSWNSVDMIQSIRKMDIESEIVSLDKTPDGYDKLKDAMYDKRIKCHKSSLLKTELQRLQLVEGKKVDHPPKGSKDIADAVAGVAYNITRLETGRILSFTPAFTGKRTF
jgi:hypothetical protein